MFLRHEMHTAPAGLLAEPGKYGMMNRKIARRGGARACAARMAQEIENAAPCGAACAAGRVRAGALRAEFLKNKGERENEALLQ